MRKSLEISNRSSCLNKADSDEPIFVLRANDPIAAQIIRLWVAAAHGVHEDEKRDEAMCCAESMDQWRMDNCPEVVKHRELDRHEGVRMERTGDLR